MGRRFALALSLLGCALSLSSLPAAAKERIVSIGPATTELILALGGEQSLIATDISSPEPKNLPVARCTDSDDHSAVRGRGRH